MTLWTWRENSCLKVCDLRAKIMLVKGRERLRQKRQALRRSGLRYVKIGVSAAAWSSVLLAASHQSHTPVVFGRYSWGYVVLLGLLVGVALTLSLRKSAWYLKFYQARAGLLLGGVSLLLSLGGTRTGDSSDRSVRDLLLEAQLRPGNSTFLHTACLRPISNIGRLPMVCHL